MSKIGIIASFLAAFITMDGQFFDGDTTRAVWRAMNDTARAAEARLERWSHQTGRR